jgi:hypothetical protein
LISSSIVGADVYRYKGATWLILTDEKRWVVELTDNGTLWYNYNFFNDILRYVSLECGGESNDYIIGWANDYFFKDIKKAGMGVPGDGEWASDIVINYGVKNVGMGVPGERANDYFFKDIKKARMGIPRVVDTVINKGVKNIGMGVPGERAADIVINEGVKEVKGDEEENKSKVIFVMDKGVKEIKANMLIDPYVVNVIENGIKNIYPDKIPHDYDWSDEFNANKVIDGGVKV